jgi:hypothetical protein
MDAGLWGGGKVAFVEQEQGAKPHVFWVLCRASQAYDEGSIPFTRSRLESTSPDFQGSTSAASSQSLKFPFLNRILQAHA